MTGVIFTIVLVNMLLFTSVGVWALQTARRDPAPRIRALAWALTAVAVALVLGAATRLVLLAVSVGRVSGRVGEFLGSGWHLVRSLSATALGLGGVVLIRKIGPPLRRSERILQALGERFSTSEISDFDLTVRELQVLAVIGAGSISDRAIADELFIAPATAATTSRTSCARPGSRIVATWSCSSPPALVRKATTKSHR